MSKEFNAIRLVVTGDKKETNLNPLWLNIHNETGCGTIAGRKIRFTDDDHDALRRYAKSKTGMDPLYESLSGTRLDLAGKTDDEKLAQGSVFGHLVVMATLGNATLPIDDQEVVVQSGTVLCAPASKIGMDRLTQRQILVVENGSLIQECHRLKVPSDWANAVIVYRGHSENARDVAQIIRSQPSERLGLFYDFDPQGLDMALQHRRGQILIPAFLPPATPSKRNAFRAQRTAMKRLQNLCANSPWVKTVSVMDEQELAVTQEHMLVHGVPLIAQPV